MSKQRNTLRTYSKTFYQESSLTTPNRVEFIISVNENPMFLNLHYNISLDYTNTIKNNPIPYLFHRIELKINNTVVDSVEQPGIVSDVLSRVHTTNGNKNEKELCGYFLQSDNTGVRKNFIGSLEHLGLGFFTKLITQQALSSCEIRLVFYKSLNYSEMFVPSVGDDGKAVVKKNSDLKISNFSIRATFAEDHTIDLDMLPREIDFIKYQHISVSNVSGKTLNSDLTNLYQGIKPPLYTLLSFRKSDGGGKSHGNVNSVQVRIGNDNYPEERQQMDMGGSSENCEEGYSMFNSFGEPEPLMTMVQWKSWPVYVVNSLNVPDTGTYRKNIFLTAEFTKSENHDLDIVLMSKALCVINKQTNTIDVEM